MLTNRGRTAAAAVFLFVFFLGATQLERLPWVQDLQELTDTIQSEPTTNN